MLFNGSNHIVTTPCRHLLKLEQEVYKAEGIEWSHIDFKDSSSCLELFEGVVQHSMSILSLLDEECIFPQVKSTLKMSSAL